MGQIFMHVWLFVFIGYFAQLMLFSEYKYIYIDVIYAVISLKPDQIEFNFLLEWKSETLAEMIG